MFIWHDDLMMSSIITYTSIDEGDAGVQDETSGTITAPIVGASLEQGKYPVVAHKLTGEYTDITAANFAKSLCDNSLAKGKYNVIDGSTLVFGAEFNNKTIDADNIEVKLAPLGTGSSPEARFGVLFNSCENFTLQNLVITCGGSPTSVAQSWNAKNLTLMNVQLNDDNITTSCPLFEVAGDDAFKTSGGGNVILDGLRFEDTGNVKQNGICISGAAAYMTLKNSYVTGTTGYIIRDASKDGALVQNNILGGAEILLSSDNSSVRNNTLSNGANVVANSCENILVALNKSIANLTLNNVKNGVALRNESDGEIRLADCESAVVAENKANVLAAKGTSYILADKNTFAQPNAIESSCFNVFGDNVTDQSARNNVGVNEGLLPKLNKELFVGMKRRTEMNDGGKMRTLSSYLNRCARTSTAVILPPGAYSTSQLSLNALSNATIYAYGVLGEFDSYTRAALNANACTGVTVNGLTIDHKNIANGQATVIAKTDSHVDVLADPGYIQNLTDPQYYAPNAGAEGFKKGSKLPYGDIGFGARTYQNNGVTRLALENDNSRKLEVGDKLTFRGLGSHVVYMGECSDMRIEDFTVYSGSGFAFMEHSGDKATTLNRVAVTPGPCALLPDNFIEALYTLGQVTTDAKGIKRGSERLLSSCDATHCTNMRQGLRAYNCIFEQMSDDATNVNGEFGRVTGYDAATKTLSYTKGDNTYAGATAPFRNGDKIVVFTRAGKLLYSGTTTSATAGTGDAHTVTLAGDMILEYGALVENLSANGAGFVFDNCYVDNNRSRGLLIKAHDGLVRNCTLKNNGMSAILIKPEIEDGWSECGYASNLTIEKNYIENSGFFTGSVLHSPINITGDGQNTFDPDYLIHTDIIIQNNTIVDRNTTYAINANGVQRLKILNNTFKVRKGLTVDKNPAVYLNGVNTVEISGNTYPAGVTVGGMVEIAPACKNITGTDVGTAASDYMEVAVEPAYLGGQGEA